MKKLIGGLAIFVIGVNAENAQPWWSPLLLILLICLVIIVSVYSATFKTGRHY